MLRVRLTKPMRLLLAFITLAASLCSVPVVGHSHGGVDHDNHRFALLDDDHRHEHEHQRSHDDSEPSLSESVYHLHGVFFGLPVSIVTGSGGPTLSGEVPLSGPHLAASSAWELLVTHRPEVRDHWPDWGPSPADFSGNISLLAFSARTSLDSVRSALALSPQARSVVLRC